MPTKIADKAQVFQGDDGKWYVRTRSEENNQTIMTSEGYNDRDWAHAVAEDTGLPVEEVTNG